MWKEKRQAAALRVFVALFSIGLALLGIGALIGGRFTYRNYWSGLVFAPLAVVVAILFLIAGFKLTKPSTATKPSRKQQRLEEQARKTRFPIDDFNKPWSGQ